MAETCCKVAGVGGSLLCSFAMVAAAVGLFATAGTAAAQGSSMAGMRGSRGASGGQPGWLDALIRFGPEILVVSLLLLALGVSVRRQEALIPVAIGGTVLYLGMYEQNSLLWMYVAIAVGTLLLLIAYAASRRPAGAPAARGG